MTMLSASAIGPPPWAGPETLTTGPSTRAATGTGTEPAVSIPINMACSMGCGGCEESCPSGLGLKAEPATPHKTISGRGGKLEKAPKEGASRPLHGPLRDANHHRVIGARNQQLQRPSG